MSVILYLQTIFRYNLYIYIYIYLVYIVVRRFEYAGDPESYTSGSVATGRASLAGQVKG